MKFRLSINHLPGVIYDSIADAVNSSLEEDPPGEMESIESARNERLDALIAASRKWIEDEAYMDVEIDTDEGTARVLTVDEAKDR